MMKELEALKRIDEKNYLTEREHKEFYSIVENALLKAQAQEKMLNEALKLNGEWAEELDDKNDIIRIIYKKNVDIRNPKHYIEVYSDDVALKVYNGFHNKGEELTQEEFNSLKEMVKQYEKR